MMSQVKIFVRRAMLLCGVLLLTSLGASFANELSPGVGMFLVARDGLPDPRFRQSVILLVQHDGEGTGGLVINRPSRLSLRDLFASEPDYTDLTGHLFYGGPVSPKSLVVLTRAAGTLPEQSEPVMDNVYLTGIPQLNDWLETQKAPPEYRVYTGYAGWAPGQLADEMDRGDWTVLPGDAESVFSEESDGLWQTLKKTRVL